SPRRRCRSPIRTIRPATWRSAAWSSGSSQIPRERSSSAWPSATASPRDRPPTRRTASPWRSGRGTPPPSNPSRVRDQVTGPWRIALRLCATGGRPVVVTERPAYLRWVTCACSACRTRVRNRWPPVRRALNIRHLTDVSHCKLHQYLCCNSKVKCQQVDTDLPGWPRTALGGHPGPAHTSLVRKQMKTMAPTRPTELQEPTSPADLQEPTSPANRQQPVCPVDLQKPIRPTVLQKRRVSLVAAATAPGAARSQVRATIEAWDVPVDTS